MLQMKIKTGRRSVVPGDLPSILGARRAYAEIGDMVDALIAQMDMLAGDADEEADGDELDGSGGEDDFRDFSLVQSGPGCPVSDPAEDDASDCCGAWETIWNIGQRVQNGGLSLTNGGRCHD